MRLPLEGEKNTAWERRKREVENSSQKIGPLSGIINRKEILIEGRMSKNLLDVRKGGEFQSPGGKIGINGNFYKGWN